MRFFALASIVLSLSSGVCQAAEPTLDEIQELLVSPEPSATRRSALEAAQSADRLAVRVWAKLGLLMDEPNDPELLARIPGDEDFASRDIFGGPKELKDYGARGLAAVTAVVNHLRTADVEALSFYGRWIVMEFPEAGASLVQGRADQLALLVFGDAGASALDATDILIAWTDELSQSWREVIMLRALVRPTFVALENEQAFSVTDLIGRYLAEREAPLTRGQEDAVVAYFLNDETLRAPADEPLEHWGKRRDRLLKVATYVEWALKRKPSYGKTLVQLVADRLLTAEDVPEAVAAAERLKEHALEYPDE